MYHCVAFFFPFCDLLHAELFINYISLDFVCFCPAFLSLPALCLLSASLAFSCSLALYTLSSPSVLCWLVVYSLRDGGTLIMIHFYMTIFIALDVLPATMITYYRSSNLHSLFTLLQVYQVLLKAPKDNFLLKITLNQLDLKKRKKSMFKIRYN